MIRRLLLHGLAAGCALALIGCGSATVNPAEAAPPPLPPGGGAALLSPEDLASGRTLYLAKCARCHKFYNPARYPDQEWHQWMNKMSRKARLQPDQKELLSRYLDVYRSGGTNLNSSPPRRS